MMGKNELLILAKMKKLRNPKLFLYLMRMSSGMLMENMHHQRE